MNVAIEGIKGYEYQYKVTALVSLLIGLEPNAEVYVESVGSEDIEIKCKNKKGIRIIEIQVKREEGSITLLKLAEWLTHFDKLSFNNSLFLRLCKDSKRLVLFVTRSRCNDQTVLFKQYIGTFSHHKKSFSIDSLDSLEFIKCLKDNKNLRKKTRLFIKRKQYINKFISSKLTVHGLLEKLRRLTIWEEVDETNIDQNISYLLAYNYRIPQNKHQNVIFNTLSIITQNRGTNTNIIPFILKSLSLNKINQPKIAPNYITRENEALYIETLKEKNILLFTGLSNCGKSECAKNIADHFVNQGFNYFLISNVYFLEKIISEEISENKIIILEDAWGHIEADKNSIKIKRHLETLMNNFPSNCLLIITSRIEILYEFNSTKNLKYCKLAKNEWYDLTVSDPKLLKMYWSYLAKTNEVPNTNIKRVSNLISNDFIFQIGELSHLSKSEKIKNKQISEAEIKDIAKISSRELANYLYGKGYGFLFGLISLCANTIEGIPIKDLKYIFSDDKSSYSLIEKSSFSISSRSEEIHTLPQYINSIELQKEISDKIVFLEKRGLIKVNNNIIYITHPEYYETGKYLHIYESEYEQNEFLILVRKCFYSLSPNIIVNAINNINLTFEKMSSELQGKIIEIVSLGLRSIFPVVEDATIVFLINHISQVKEEIQKELFTRIEHGIEINDICWEDDIPFIVPDRGIEAMFIQYKEIDINEVEMTIVSLQNDKSVSTQKIWDLILHMYRNKNVKIDEKVLIRLLKLYEVFIRTHIAFLITSRFFNIRNLVQAVFNDNHPSVLHHAIRGIFSSWILYDYKTRNYIQKYLLSAISKPATAIAAKKYLSDFGDPHAFRGVQWNEYNKKDRRIIWTLWSKVFPVCFSALPIDTYLNWGHIFMALDEAVKYGSLRNLFQLMSIWIYRIDKKLKKEFLLEPMEYYVTEYLILTTKLFKDLRKDLFNKIISYPDTSFLFLSVHLLLYYWKELTNYEKSAIAKLLSGDRPDIRWLKALVLIRYDVPSHLSIKLYGIKNIFKLSPEDFFRLINLNIIEDSLHIFCGHPQPLWWLGIHHVNEQFWKKIIIYVLRIQQPECFNIALREFIDQH